MSGRRTKPSATQNRSRSRRSHLATGDHPGEQSLVRAGGATYTGPSPRALGAELPRFDDPALPGTIPTGAGSRWSRAARRCGSRDQDHPRTRGEQFGLSGCWAPSMVLALACRLKPSSRRRPATVSAETRCPWRVSSAASFRVDFVVQRRGDIGSPRSSGSTSASSAGLSPESSSAAFFRPLSGWRTRPNGAWQEPSSAAPRETVASRTPRLQRRRS